MKKIYWRISYNNIGIYEALKKELWNKNDSPKDEWKNLKESNAFTWLKTPDFYNENYYSYFTELGYKLFIENTYPIIIKYLDEKNIKVEEKNMDDGHINIIYSDEHQIVICDKMN